MTAPLITVLIPNFNRPSALARALKSAFASIEFASASGLVNVLVVDDYSDVDISNAVREYQSFSNFTFLSQPSKCGNAELAFLSALEKVETEYVWLVGNDDQLSVEAVETVVNILVSCDAGLILLNPIINKATRTYVPICTSTAVIAYEKAEDLFFDFGFVTSTTTFPCLVMKTEPVREFHRTYRLTAHATVYSHSFTIFGALREQRAFFLSTPIVTFTLNERFEEHRKLIKQAPEGIEFYHHSLGLARLIKACSSATDVPIRRIGASFEDEVDKDSMAVLPTYLSHFLVSFFIEQLCREQFNCQRPRPGFGHLFASEIDEILRVIEDFADEKLTKIALDAIDIFTRDLSPSAKIRLLRLAKGKLHQLTQNNYMSLKKLSNGVGPKKMTDRKKFLSPLRGCDGAMSRLLRSGEAARSYVSIGLKT